MRSADIDIVYKDKDSTRENYYTMAETLDGLFRPVFYFKNRAITVRASSYAIVDGILHFTFSINFYDDVETIENENLMEYINLQNRR